MQIFYCREYVDSKRSKIRRYQKNKSTLFRRSKNNISPPVFQANSLLLNFSIYHLTFYPKHLTFVFFNLIRQTAFQPFGLPTLISNILFAIFSILNIHPGKEWLFDLCIFLTLICKLAIKIKSLTLNGFRHYSHYPSFQYFFVSYLYSMNTPEKERSTRNLFFDII